MAKAQEQPPIIKIGCDCVNSASVGQVPVQNGDSFCIGSVLSFNSCSIGVYFEPTAFSGADTQCAAGRIGTYTIIATPISGIGPTTTNYTTFTLPVVAGSIAPIVNLTFTNAGCYSISHVWSFVNTCDPLSISTFTNCRLENNPSDVKTVCVNPPAAASPPTLVNETPNPICANTDVCFLTDIPDFGTINFGDGSGTYQIVTTGCGNFGGCQTYLVPPVGGNTQNIVSVQRVFVNGIYKLRVCYNYSTAGNYQVSRINQGACGGNVLGVFINLAVLQNKTNFTSTLDCNGNVTFTPTISCPTNIPTTYNWNFGDGQVGLSYSNVNGGIITHHYTSSNLFNVSLSANGGATIAQIVNPIVGPQNIELQAAFSDPTKACSPTEQYTLTGVPVGSTVNWTITGGNFTTPNNQTTVGVNWTATENDPVAGPFLEGGSITVTITNGTCTYTKTFEIGSCCASRTATQNISSPKGEITINDVFPTVSQLNGGTYYIDGKLIIDKDFTLVGTHFKMGPYAEIEVRDPYTFTLDNSTITAGCEIMWQQIYVGFKANFVAKNNSRVEDGITAVFGENGGTVIVRDSYFNKNHIAFFIIDYASGTYPLEITNTKISCSYATPYSVVGVTYPNLGLRIPYAGQRSLRGVELNNVDNAKIGDPTTVANKNTFFQLDYGIYARRSSVEVYNNHFKEIYDATKTSTNEYAIYVDNQNKPQIKINRTLKVGDPVNATATNMFELCEVGIETKFNVNSYIHKNSFDDMFWAMRINFNSNNNTVVIKQNTITDMMRGIECSSNTWCATDITLNSLNYNQPPTSMPNVIKLRTQKACLKFFVMRGLI
ncbi:MAG: PKD domain-containing protein, partial [Chitinophagaceae bacterium]|nr:PKD domain-containing protein [Chitinophagaceae bacterium]